MVKWQCMPRLLKDHYMELLSFAKQNTKFVCTEGINVVAYDTVLLD